jgi:double-stranded uracil-DNA glycosylase
LLTIMPKKRQPKKQAKKVSAKASAKAWQVETLPDYLRKGLDIVFVGLNPGLYSARVGHYFAMPQNRFWPALSASGLVPHPVGPKDDVRLLEWGIGLSDMVKRPTSGIHELSRGEFRQGAKALQEKLLHYKPRIVCFVGLTGYRIWRGENSVLGPQAGRLGESQVFVLPSTSPRNARYSLDDIIRALKDLRQYRDRLNQE